MAKFRAMQPAGFGVPLYIQFEGEAGIDQGGLTSDLYSSFGIGITGGDGDNGCYFGQYGLPREDTDASAAADYTAIGRALCKSIIDGRGMPVVVAPAVLDFLLVRGSLCEGNWGL